MIASPSDVPGERAAVRQVLADWNVVHSQKRQIVLLPVGWETHASPQMGEHPQAILNKQILERSDLLVGVFWTRLGTPTPKHPSGTVEEVEEHLSMEKPVMLYFSNQPVRPDSVDSVQYQNLLAFKASCKDRGLLEEYEDAADFREKFARQLQLKLNDDPYFQAANSSISDMRIVELSPTSSDMSLSGEAKVLLKTAAEGNGVITRLTHMGGTDVQAGGRNFVENNERRSIARWEAAIEELEEVRLTEDKAGNRQVYFLTHEGYRIADTLPNSA
jgi:hypothetical protein